MKALAKSIPAVQIPAESTRSKESEINEHQWLKPSELPDGKFILEASWANASNPPIINLLDYLNLIDVKSISEVNRLRSATDFPPTPYSNTGRGDKPYGPNYLGLGSGSAVFGLNSGVSRALSAVFTLDQTGHGQGKKDHMNVRIVGWPADVFKHADSIDFPMHTLPADAGDMTLLVAAGSKIEKSTIIIPRTGSQHNTGSDQRTN